MFLVGLVPLVALTLVVAATYFLANDCAYRAFPRAMSSPNGGGEEMIIGNTIPRNDNVYKA